MIILAACDEDKEEDFPSNVTLKGSVLTENEYGQPLYDQRGGVTVNFETGYRTFTSTGDALGKYALSSAPVGTYVITYSKPGFGTVEKTGVIISTVDPQYPVDHGAQVLPTVKLVQKSTASFNNLSLDYTWQFSGQDTLITLLVSASMVPAPANGLEKGFRVFLAKVPSVSASQYRLQKHFSTTDGDIAVAFDNTLLADSGIKRGDQVYVVLYGDAPQNTQYINSKGTLVFPNLSVQSSEVATLALP